MEHFTIAQQSFTGRRENNEDACLALQLGEKGLFLAVADGMGGYEGGEIASNLVLFKIKQFLEKNYHDSPDPENLKSVLAECFELAQYTIHQKILEEPALKGMGTTLCAVLISDNHYAYGNIGDSRIYLIKKESTHQITIDHTYIEEFRQKFREQVTPEFLAQYGHVLTRTIDGNQDLPDIFPAGEPYLSLNPDDMLLLCSDGLLIDKSDPSNTFITQPVNSSPSVEEVVRQLVFNAYDNGASDNITVVLARYNQQAITRELPVQTIPVIPVAPETTRNPANDITKESPFLSGKALKTIGIIILGMFTILTLVCFFVFNRFT